VPSPVVIRAENVSKKYVISHLAKQQTIRDAMHHGVRLLWRRLRSQAKLNREEFWALKDVNFEVKQGEVLGVIGRNGAGKSTLLKILSRITEPTTGRISLKGRVASLLEVGTGFHPELTGRENIFLNGAILGMSRAELRNKFDEIVTFAEIANFIDTPVKRYSSGMYVRLAFAVAAHLDPEILIIDEVLAVGDLAFQRKCLAKAASLASAYNRTVILVTHTIPIVTGICSKVLYMRDGSIHQEGKPEQVIPAYLEASSRALQISEPNTGNDLLEVQSSFTTDERERPQHSFTTESTILIHIRFRLKRPGNTVLNPVIALRDIHDNLVFTTSNFNEPSWYQQPTEPGSYHSICTIPANILNDQRYTVQLLFCSNLRKVELAPIAILELTITDSGKYRALYTDVWQGITRPNCLWQTIKESPDASN
jgi:lipopolysaccharide transport system ATP-binding protein